MANVNQGGGGNHGTNQYIPQNQWTLAPPAGPAQMPIPPQPPQHPPLPPPPQHPPQHPPPPPPQLPPLPPGLGAEAQSSSYGPQYHFGFTQQIYNGHQPPPGAQTTHTPHSGGGVQVVPPQLPPQLPPQPHPVHQVTHQGAGGAHPPALTWPGATQQQVNIHNNSQTRPEYFFVRDLDGTWILRTVGAIIRDMQPGHWAQSQVGYPYFVRVHGPH